MGYKRLTQEDFIYRAKKVHGDLYDYSKVVFIRTVDKVIIKCNRCGQEFLQAPKYHMNGQGCPYCLDYKRQQTMLKRYGTRCALCNGKFREKGKLTTRAKYGTEYATQSQQIKDKTKKTCQERYGTDFTLQVTEIREKGKETIKQKFGVDHPSQSEKIKEKKRQTSLKNFGVENPWQSEEVKSKIRKTNLKKYGFEVASKNEIVKQKERETLSKNTERVGKIQKTCLERYGVINVFQAEEIKDKIKETFMKRYGVINPMYLQEIKNKIFDTMKKNKTFNSSKPEEKIYKLLLTVFNEEHVERQYRSNEYPWHCDFYIIPLDLYIEYQGHWSHGTKPYEGTLEDLEIINHWKEKSNKSYFYKKAINIWTRRDVIKRNHAKEKGLKWIEFFNINDFMLWFEKINDNEEINKVVTEK